MQIDPTPIVKTWGPWGVILIAAGFFVWKWVLPRIDQHLADKREQRRLEREALRKRDELDRETIRKRDEQFVTMISESLSDEQQGRAVERDRFLAIVDGSLKQQTEVLRTLTDSVNQSLSSRREQ